MDQPKPGNRKGLAQGHTAGQWLSWAQMQSFYFPVLNSCHSAHLLFCVSAEHFYSPQSCAGHYGEVEKNQPCPCFHRFISKLFRDKILMFTWSKRQHKSIYRNASVGTLACSTEVVTKQWAQGGCMAFWGSQCLIWTLKAGREYEQSTMIGWRGRGGGPAAGLKPTGSVLINWLLGEVALICTVFQFFWFK